MKDNLLSEARAYIARELPIFPVRLSWNAEQSKWEKRPLIKKWQEKTATTELELNNWASLPALNGWGLTTGKSSGVVVLDIDNPDLVSEFNLPNTPRVKSISGGYHYYFRYPKDMEVKSHKGLLPKVDIRADGGYIVIPPSAADADHFYQWEMSFEDTEFAELPIWLRDLLQVTQSPHLSDGSFEPEQPVEHGERHKKALQAIGHFSLKYGNLGEDKVWEKLTDWMQKKFAVPFGQEENTWLKKSFDAYAPQNISKASDKDSNSVSAHVVKLIVEGSFQLFKSAKDKKTYVGHPNKPLVVIPTDSEEFYEVVSLEYYSKHGAPLMRDSLKRVLPTIRALINQRGQEITLWNRVAMKDDFIFYDLFEDHNFVSISSSGFQIVGAEVIQHAGIRFIRYPHQRPQVLPYVGASINDAYHLFDFLAIKDEGQKQLLLCHLVACLIPNISRCMLVLHGSRGSAKSTTLRLLRLLIDPAVPLLLRMPDKDTDLQIFLDKNYFSCFDNVSWITKAVSDSLAMMITGGGTISRKLFSDSEIVTTDLKSCIALNGINLAIREPDLLERSLIIETKRLETVKSEEQLKKDFELGKPRILGGLFSLVVATLQNLSDETSGTFRMADYYRYASAAAVSLGLSREQFEQMFQQNIDRQNEAAIESSPLAQVIVDFMADKAVAVEMRSSELYTQLSERAKEIGVDKGMPRGANNLWKALNLLRIDLEAVGIDIERISRSDGSYIRMVNKKPSVEAVEAMEAEKIADSF